MFRRRVFSEVHALSKNGAPPQSTTGVARRSWIASDRRGERVSASRGDAIATISKNISGAVSTRLTQKRRDMSLSSESSWLPAAATSSGSSAMPQTGQGPGFFSRTSGSIGQTQSVPAAASRLGRAAPAALPLLRALDRAEVDLLPVFLADGRGARRVDRHAADRVDLAVLRHRREGRKAGKRRDGSHRRPVEYRHAARAWSSARTPENHLRDFSRFLGYFRRRPGPYVWGFLTMAGSTALFLAMPRLVGQAIAELSSGVSTGRIGRAAGIIVLLAVGDAICLFLTRRLLIGASRDDRVRDARGPLRAPPAPAPGLVPEEPRRRPDEPGGQRPVGRPDDDRARGSCRRRTRSSSGASACVLMFLVSPDLIARRARRPSRRRRRDEGHRDRSRTAASRRSRSSSARSRPRRRRTSPAPGSSAPSPARRRRRLASTRRTASFRRRNLGLARLNALYFPMLQAHRRSRLRRRPLGRRPADPRRGS